MRAPTAPASDAISIHALLAEGDRARQSVLKDIKISIHALLAEGDPRRKETIKRRG